MVVPLPLELTVILLPHTLYITWSHSWSFPSLSHSNSHSSPCLSSSVMATHGRPPASYCDSLMPVIILLRQSLYLTVIPLPHTHSQSSSCLTHSLHVTWSHSRLSPSLSQSFPLTVMPLPWFSLLLSSSLLVSSRSQWWRPSPCGSFLHVFSQLVSTDVHPPASVPQSRPLTVVLLPQTLAPHRQQSSPRLTNSLTVIPRPQTITSCHSRSSPRLTVRPRPQQPEPRAGVHQQPRPPGAQPRLAGDGVEDTELQGREQHLGAGPGSSDCVRQGDDCDCEAGG